MQGTTPEQHNTALHCTYPLKRWPDRSIYLICEESTSCFGTDWQLILGIQQNVIRKRTDLDLRRLGVFIDRDLYYGSFDENYSFLPVCRAVYIFPGYVAVYMVRIALSRLVYEILWLFNSDNHFRLNACMFRDGPQLRILVPCIPPLLVTLTCN